MIDSLHPNSPQARDETHGPPNKWYILLFPSRVVAAGLEGEVTPGALRLPTTAEGMRAHHRAHGGANPD